MKKYSAAKAMRAQNTKKDLYKSPRKIIMKKITRKKGDCTEIDYNHSHGTMICTKFLGSSIINILRRREEIRSMTARTYESEKVTFFPPTHLKSSISATTSSLSLDLEVHIVSYREISRHIHFVTVDCRCVARFKQHVIRVLLKRHQ